MKAKLVVESLNEVVSDKDITRIKDMFTKSKGDDEKVLQLARNMAKSIDDVDKAQSRAEAAWQILGKNNNPIADIFLDRVAELGGTSPIVLKQNLMKAPTVNVPAVNPKVDISTLKKGFGGYAKDRRGFTRVYSNQGVIFLPTYSAIVLWKDHIIGQMSDGAWENSNPQDHWIYWSNLEPRLGQPQVQSSGHPIKEGYNLVSLIQYTGDEMIASGRMAKALGPFSLDLGSYTRSVIESFPKDGPFNFNKYKADTIAKNDWRKNEDYWKGLDQEAIDAFYRTKYDEGDLRKDLRIIREAMKNRKIIG